MLGDEDIFQFVDFGFSPLPQKSPEPVYEKKSPEETVEEVAEEKPVKTEALVGETVPEEKVVVEDNIENSLDSGEIDKLINEYNNLTYGSACIAGNP